jgi:serine/threonine protein kinase
MVSEILGTRYQIKQELAKKAGRRTLLCCDQVTGKQVVVKLLTFSSDFEWDDLKLFEREAEVLKSLSHPTIPSYLNYFEVNSTKLAGFALVQSYIPAQSLEEEVGTGRIFAQAKVEEIAKAILEILIYLHGQNPPVIHRDIKPSNILLGDRSGNSVGQVYLVDFGSVQTVAAKEGATPTVVGTYGYMPPEQFGGRTVPASDLYSLGATLIYLVTGIHPADLPQKDFRIQFEQLANFSPAFSDWLRRTCEPSLEKRFNSASVALQALNQSHDSLDINKPLGSRIILKKSSDFLEFFIPATLIIYNLLEELLFLLFFLCTGIFFLYVLLVKINFVSLFVLIIFWFFSLYFGQTIFTHFLSARLRLNSQKISLTREFLRLIKFKFTRSSPRENITKLVYFPEYAERKETYGGHTSLVTVGAQLEVWAGIYRYKLPGADISLSEQEVKWLAKELSVWLDLPIQHVSRQA